MSESGTPFPHGQIVSAAKLNRKTITPTIDLNSETPLPGQVFFNLINNSGFLANSMVAPDDVTFVNAVNRAGGVVLASTLEHGHNKGVWIRLYGNKGIKSMKDCIFGIKVGFTRPA